jgi:hypothetical protein
MDPNLIARVLDTVFGDNYQELLLPVKRQAVLSQKALAGLCWSRDSLSSQKTPSCCCCRTLSPFLFYFYFTFFPPFF